MADRIYVTYTPTGAPGSFHAAIHYERTSISGGSLEGSKGLYAVLPPRWATQE